MRVGESRGDGSRGNGGGVLGGGVGWERRLAGNGVGDGGVLRLGGGEKRNSLLSSQSRRSWTSFRLFLVLFAGGGAVSGDGAVAVDAAGVSVGGVEARAGAFDMTLAALPRLWRRRWRRRCFPAAAWFTPGTGTLQVTVRTWCPAAWLKIRRAFSPLAWHRSNSAVKSAAMTAGWGSGQGCFTARTPSPLATLAHVGEPGEFGGQGWVSWLPAWPAGTPTTPQLGEAWWRGVWQVDRTAARGPPQPQRGGGRWVARRVSGCWRSVPLPTRVSSVS